MNEIIEKYEAKLDYLNKSVDSYSHLMDENTLEMMEDLKLLLTEVIVDFKTICEKSNHVKPEIDLDKIIKVELKLRKEYE